jgi:SAM-dependent methyltransferase
MDDLPKGLADSGAIEISQVLGVLDGGRVLDVGTGKGDFIVTLAEHLGGHSKFIGVDLNVEKLEKGRERLEEMVADLLEMDGGDLAFDNGAFDTVCISNSLHHLERAGDVMAEMFRVLRPGGAFILQEMFCDGEQTPAQVTDLLTHHWASRVDTLFGTFHANTYTREEIGSVIEPLDLRDVKVFETTHSIKCLTCEDRFKCSDPMEPEFIKSELEDIEDDLKKLEAFPDREHADMLSDEGRALMERVRETGVSPASTMFVIGRK